MRNIIDTFKEYFNFEISFPNPLPKKGNITDEKTGWSIMYVVKKDKYEQLFLDFTAENRMTNSRHHRITQDGKIIFLEMYKEGFGYDSKIPGDKEKKEQEYFEHNRKISRILTEKGLL